MGLGKKDPQNWISMMNGPLPDKRLRPEKPQSHSFLIMFTQKFMLRLMRTTVSVWMSWLRTLDVNWTKSNATWLDPNIWVMRWFYRVKKMIIRLMHTLNNRWRTTYVSILLKYISHNSFLIGEVLPIQGWCDGFESTVSHQPPNKLIKSAVSKVFFSKSTGSNILSK